MTTSVIIPTYKGASKILNIIKALEQQTIQDFETIVMIDGSPDNTKDVLSNYNHNLKKLTVINQDNHGRAQIRNKGAEIATGQLLIFFDDDMRPLPNCIAEHLLFHQQHTNSFMTGGLGEDLSRCNTDIQKYKAFLSEKWVIKLKEWKKPLIKENLFLTAANFSSPKNIFQSMKGFDERLNDAEDWDLAVRAFKKEIPIYYNHDAFAWHDDYITCQSYIKRQKEYRSFHQKLLALKPELYTEFNDRQAPLPSGIKSFIFKLFKNRFLVWSIDHMNWFNILPKKIRYKAYDLVITSHFLYQS